MEEAIWLTCHINIYVKENDHIWQQYRKAEVLREEDELKNLPSIGDSIHPMQALLDAGYKAIPEKPGVIIAADGNAYESQGLYDEILQWLNTPEGREYIRQKRSKGR